MRVGADDRSGVAKPWPRWLAVAAASLVAATAYLCFSVVRAVNSGGRQPIETVVFSDAAARGDTPISTATLTPSARPTPRPTPESRTPEPRGELIPGLAEGVFDSELLQVIEEAVGDDAEHIAVSARRISDGKYASFNGDETYYAASTFKLAVLYEAERRHFLGQLEYSDTLTISEEDAAEDLGTSGYLEFEEDGSITFANLLRAMITFSDNSSAVALLHEFGSWNVDATLRGLGIETMTVNTVELWTTASDLALLMEAIYVGEGVSEPERSHMRELLLGQTIRNGIPAAVGAGRDGSLLVGNKTGTWEGAQHDVAFIEAQSGAYVLAVLTDGSLEGWQALHRVSARIHTAMTKSP